MVAAEEAQKAANRNGHKRHWRNSSLPYLFAKLVEEGLEFIWAVVSRDPERVRAELGDFVWCATMIADRNGYLTEPEIGGNG